MRTLNWEIVIFFINWPGRCFYGKFLFIFSIKPVDLIVIGWVIESNEFLFFYVAYEKNLLYLLW